MSDMITQCPGLYSFQELALPNGEINRNFKPLQHSNYYKYLKKYWLKYFTPEQILVVNGDKLGKRNPGKEMEIIQRFLGVAVRIDESSFVYVKSKGFYCQRLANGEPRCLSSSKGRQHPSQNPQTISKLKDYYRKYNHRLFRLIGRDFGWNSS